MELLSHAELPWLEANADRPQGGTAKIKQEVIRAFFSTAGGPDPDLPWPNPADLAPLVEGADERRRAPAQADDLAVLVARRQIG